MKNIFNYPIYLLLIILLTSSCALHQYNLNSKKLSPYAEFTRFSIIRDSLRSLSFESFIDEREDKNFLGFMKTGIKYKDTPVYLVLDTDRYFKNYWRGELSKRGVIFKEDQEFPKLRVTLKSLQLKSVVESSTEQAHCDSNFYIEVLLNSDETVNYQNSIKVSFSSPGDSYSSIHKSEKTLSTCLELSIEKLVNDPNFISVLKR